MSSRKSRAREVRSTSRDAVDGEIRPHLEAGRDDRVNSIDAAAAGVPRAMTKEGPVDTSVIPSLPEKIATEWKATGR
jgi:hypothetical protein